MAASEAPTPEPSGGTDVATDPTPAADPVSEAPSAPDVFADTPDQAVFDGGYVKNIRAEGAKYRTEANELRAQLATQKERLDASADVLDVYDQYDADDQTAWRSLMTELKDNPVSAAQRFRAVSDAILAESGIDPGQATEQEQAAAAEAAVNELTPGVDQTNMSPDQVSELVTAELERREQETTRQSEVAGVFSQLKEAGYDAQSDDPQTAGLGFAALWYTNNHGDGDLASGIKFVSDIKQAAVDEYVNGLKSGKRATPAPDGRPSSQNPPEIKTWDDARRATQAYLDQGNQAGIG